MKRHRRKRRLSTTRNRRQTDTISTQSVAETTADNPSPVLLDELIEEIMLKLPVKFIIQLRCVSKTWKTLISNPHFTKRHLLTSKRYPQLVYTTINNNESLKIESYTYPFEPLLKKPTNVKPVNINMNLNQFRILGSCNGLLCVYDTNKSNVVLYNPSINYISQPSPTIKYVSDVKVLRHYGFGYDHVNDKYKLLVVIRDFGLRNGEIVTLLYTFGENSLKKIQNFPSVPNGFLGKYVGGTLNWIVKRGLFTNIDRGFVLSFDLEKETYNEILLPKLDNGREILYNSKLHVLGNHLCVCFECSSRTVVWWMKEYGVAESWSTLMIISHWGLDITEPSFVDPVFISENGIVYVKTMCAHLVLYDLRKDVPKHLWIFDKHKEEIYIHHESMVSLQW